MAKPGTIAGGYGRLVPGGSRSPTSGSIIGRAEQRVLPYNSEEFPVRRGPGRRIRRTDLGPGTVLGLAAGSGQVRSAASPNSGTLAVDKAANWTLQGTNDVSDVSDQGTLTLGANGTLTVAGPVIRLTVVWLHWAQAHCWTSSPVSDHPAAAVSRQRGVGGTACGPIWHWGWHIGLCGAAD